MSGALENVLRLLPEELRRALESFAPDMRQAAEELRLRIGQPPALLVQGVQWTFLEGRVVCENDIDLVLQRATQASIHSAQEQLRRGFLTSRGGVRIGVCGTVTQEGCISGIKDVSSLAIRVARQIKNAGAAVAAELLASPCSVLILSPPGGGKTTFLRELIRNASQSGARVALADERGEVAGFFAGKPAFDIGSSTDVLTGCPKAPGVMMLLRSMNPQIIALDEITAEEDVAAVSEISNCGVKIFATAHGAAVADLEKRPLYRRLLELRAFDKAVVISGRGAARGYEVVSL